MKAAAPQPKPDDAQVVAALSEFIDQMALLVIEDIERRRKPARREHGKEKDEDFENARTVDP